MKEKKGFIFDLDGVIVDTAKYHFLAWKNLAEELDINFTEKDNERLKGVSRVRSLEIILELGNKTLSKEDFDNYLVQKNEEYLDYIDKMDENEILPDVLKTLKFLKEKGYHIVLGSASKNARRILKQVNLIDYFDAIVDGNDVSKAKPDPEVFVIGATKVGVENEACVVFEDSVAGIQASNTAGMTSIGIGSKTVLGEADYVFADFTEMSDEFLNKLIK
ncbi:beta-phosphoglucomutase [Galbibacter sp. EGI 63066]|uniref:beta-phosphoglucomutase n=1 Tax=Galbibacter sp. EGI 63066 TaxID=2993559 RepID=UPI0022494D51|nr:beta-phosphoglucomutase [Galbibacter sp. EGI 63066]MCX2679908.1 beta-phosphoglucomutase [Galbibacter sp. EGI 63066]